MRMTILFLCVLGGMAPTVWSLSKDQGSNNKASQREQGPEQHLPASVIKAYQEQGGQYCRFNPEKYDTRFMKPDSPIPAGYLPGFKFTRASFPRRAQSLPAVSKRFGLDLASTGLTDFGARTLKGLNNLVYLNLVNTKVTDKGLKEIGLLQNLEILNLDKTQSKDFHHISNAGMKEVGKLKKLTILTLTGSARVSDVGMKHISTCVEMRRLILDGTGVTDKGLAYLRNLTKLERLSIHAPISSTPISDKGLKHLQGLTNLKLLHLGCSTITDRGLRYLAQMKKLSYLNLRASQVGNGQLKILETLPRLATLDLATTQIDEGVTGSPLR